MVYKVRGRADYFEPGDYNAACSMCGRKRKASQLVRNWMGQWRCPEHNEPRQPQDFVRGVQDIQAAPWVQIQQDYDLGVCTFNACSGIPGYAQPGCMTPSRSALLPDIEDGPLYPLSTPQGEVITTPSGGVILVPIRDPGDYYVP
jgi:hypothetical protein